MAAKKKKAGSRPGQTKMGYARFNVELADQLGLDLLDLHIHPYYHELRDDFAFTRTGELQQGWNEILIKLSKCSGARQYGFLLRVTDEAGANFADLVYSPEKLDKRPAEERKQAAGAGQAWYRIPVPVSASGVKLPRFKGRVTVFYNGEMRQVDPDTSTVRFPQAAEGKGNVLIDLAHNNSFTEGELNVLLLRLVSRGMTVNFFHESDDLKKQLLCLFPSLPPGRWRK
jgi:hypothetical protein